MKICLCDWLFLFSEKKSSTWKGSQIVLLVASGFSICLSAAAFGISLYNTVITLNKDGKYMYCFHPENKWTEILKGVPFWCYPSIISNLFMENGALWRIELHSSKHSHSLNQGRHRYIHLTLTYGINVQCCLRYNQICKQ